jgi:hypothetical protein
MVRAMKVTIGVEVREEDVKAYVRRYGGDPNEIDDADWCEYVEMKYGIGLGASAQFCN